MCGDARWETTRDDDGDVGESFCIPVSSIFSPRSFIRDPRVVRACVSSRALARECEIQHGTSRRHRHSDARPHSDARWRPRSHDPARSAIFHSLGVRTDGVPRNGHVREYVFGALRAAAAELTFDAERGGPKRVADERSAMVEKQRQHHL